MLKNKAYKFRIYPNQKQMELIEKTFGCTRFVFNYFLEQSISMYKEEKKTLRYKDYASMLVELKKEKEDVYQSYTSSMMYLNSIVTLNNNKQGTIKGVGLDNQLIVELLK